MIMNPLTLDLNKPKMTQDNAPLWDCLKTMKDPGTQQDIVTLGLVQDIQVEGRRVMVQLVPPPGDPYLHEALAKSIQRKLTKQDDVEQVKVSWPKHEGCTCGGDSVNSASLSLPILENGFESGQESMNDSLLRTGIAPEAGYGEDGPEQLLSPELDIPDDRYEGWPPVYQWEIDPADPTLKCGEEHARIGNWEYEIWWQAHPSDLVYVCIQALQDDAVTGGPERAHPTGRNVVVNLVYDHRREAVLAVYGTARDFRPFIEAFRTGCGLEQTTQETEA